MATEKQVENKQKDEEKTNPDAELTIIESILVKKDKIDTTRRNRISLSERFTRYSRRWSFIFFVINIEAVIFVLLSLTGEIDKIELGPFAISFNLLSGIFTIYVILLQYYINILNYNERGLRIHYHQLELRDLILNLNTLIIKHNTKEIDIMEKTLIEDFNVIVDKYQLALKNNENHRNIDHEKTSFLKKSRAFYSGESKEYPGKRPPLDFTLDNHLIWVNIALTIFMFFVIGYVLFLY